MKPDLRYQRIIVSVKNHRGDELMDRLSKHIVVCDYRDRLSADPCLEKTLQLPIASIVAQIPSPLASDNDNSFSRLPTTYLVDEMRTMEPQHAAVVRKIKIVTPSGRIMQASAAELKQRYFTEAALL